MSVGQALAGEREGTPPAARTAPADRSAGGAVVVADDVEPGPGQICRRDFLAAGTARVRAVADAELAEVGRSADQCPYLADWVAWFRAKPTAELERAVVLYARPDRRTADGLLAALDDRVRAGVRQWKAGRPVEVPSGVPAGDVAAAAAGAVVQRRAEPGAGARAASPPGRAADIQARLGAGRPLDGALRHRMEGWFGSRLDRVRLHTTAAAGAIAREERAHALAVGDDVVFAPGRYRPGTLLGDALLAHEVTHTLQQSGGATAVRSGEALEREADEAALAVATGGRTPRVRGGAGLGLHACRCGPEAEPPSLLDRLRDETDAYRLADELAEASETELGQLADGAPPGSALATAVRWERAWRARDWAALATLARRSGERGLHEPYGDRLMELITAGSTTITIDATDRDFADWVEAVLARLAAYPTGFRLLVELLATGKPVTLRATTGGSERLPEAGHTSDEGQLQVFGKDNKLLPTAQQKRSAGVGSIVALNRAQIESMVTPGGEVSAPELIDTDVDVSVGHELIHALHHARGEAIPNPAGGLIPVVGTINPVTGGIESVSELFTITGGRRYDVRGAGQATFNVSTDISENALRAERGLPARLSHDAVTRHATVALTGTETLDQIVDRYRTPDGTPVAAPVKAAIRRVIVSWYRADTFPTGRSVPALPLPTPEYLATHLLVVERNEELGLQVGDLVGP